ncbi:uncharacterized protein LOC108154452 [Drosophila miranda]|uniref:uncharacterized protein LOC108154452 n=1 Tax=Drosophila miranda TaxID=7229 RepID=UPI0007E70101|nr:uncharacterized protein LOC108154452 [Drosophila miranda]
MFSKTSLLLAMLGLGLVMGTLAKVRLPTTPKIHRLEQQTELLSVQNPVATQMCFGFYGPILNNVSTTYEINYSQCANSYDFDSQNIYCRWNNTLIGLSHEGDSGCNTFVDCATIVDYVEAFECFARVGAQESKTMYSISANATQIAAIIQSDLLLVESRWDICVNDAERDFVEDTASTYEHLNACLNGAALPNEPVSTEGPSTTEIPDIQGTTGFRIYWN